MKPSYGLEDAPVGWQLCLKDFYDEQDGVESQHDENFYIWWHNGECIQIATAHMDDNALGAKQGTLDKSHAEFTKRFNKIARQRIPFVHCGVAYKKLDKGGFSMDQNEFCQKMKPYNVEKWRPDS